MRPAVQVFADLEVEPVFQREADEETRGALPAALELVVSAQNGASSEELTLWRHTVR